MESCMGSRLTPNYLRSEVARRKHALAQLEAKLELLGQSRATYSDPSHDRTARMLRRAIGVAQTRIRRLEEHLPASDEI